MGQHLSVGPVLLIIICLFKLTLSFKIKKIHVSVAPEIPFLETHQQMDLPMCKEPYVQGSTSQLSLEAI